MSYQKFVLLYKFFSVSGSGEVGVWQGNIFVLGSLKNICWGLYRDGIDSYLDWKESGKQEGEVNDMGIFMCCLQDF